MKRLYLIRSYHGNAHAFTFVQYLLLRFFLYLVKYSWSWSAELGWFYRRYLRWWIQRIYFKAHFAITGYLDKGTKGLKAWSIKPQVPGNWTMEDLARAAFKKGFQVIPEFEPLLSTRNLYELREL